MQTTYWYSELQIENKYSGKPSKQLRGGLTSLWMPPEKKRRPWLRTGEL